MIIRTVLIGDKFHLTSYGGIAYDLVNDETQTCAFVQGDDADRFSDELEAVEAAFPEKSADEVLAWLWDQCEYCLIATPVHKG